MGRNFISVCDLCEVQLMHLRGKESDHMQAFANEHMRHKENTRVLDDYVEEPPEHYRDLFYRYNPRFDEPKHGEDSDCRGCKSYYAQNSNKVRSEDEL